MLEKSSLSAITPDSEHPTPEFKIQVERFRQELAFLRGDFYALESKVDSICGHKPLLKSDNIAMDKPEPPNYAIAEFRVLVNELAETRTMIAKELQRLNQGI